MNQELGSYTLLEPIGSGGSGVVYAARRADGEEVAVKVLREELALSPRDRRRFVEEAVRMGRVAHRGLIEVLDAGDAGDRPYIAMPLLHGETLSSRLRRQGLPLATALDDFTVLAAAVAALHGAGLVHRDIKPENVFLDRERGPVLLDLGIARELADDDASTTETGVVRGTPAYMAPERFFGTPASVATDVYELAVVLYMMLTRELPWRDRTSPEGAKGALEGRLHPRHPSELGVHVPPALARVVLRALSTRPETRPDSATALLDAVVAAKNDVTEDRETTTSDVAVVHRSATLPPLAPVRRAPMLVGGAAVLAIVAGVGWRASHGERAVVASSAPPPIAARTIEPHTAEPQASIESRVDAGVVAPIATVKKPKRFVLPPASASVPAAVSAVPAPVEQPEPASRLYQDRK